MDISMKLNKIEAINLIKKNIDLFCFFDKSYIFGSILKPDKYSEDIDVLLLYSTFSYLREMRTLTDFYLENARLIKKALEGDNFRALGVRIFGADNAPYLWVQFPGKKSWDVFDDILNRCRIVTTPEPASGQIGRAHV